MFTFVFTPRASAEIPHTVGPVSAAKLVGNSIRDADSGALLAECKDGHWVFDGKRFYRVDCAGPLAVNIQECDAAQKDFGPFEHFSLSDGLVFVDRALFAQLNSDEKWYVEQAKVACPTLLLLPSAG